MAKKKKSVDENDIIHHILDYFLFIRGVKRKLEGENRVAKG